MNEARNRLATYEHGRPMTDGRQVVERLLAEPPIVHGSVDGHPGVWSTDADCYHFIAASAAAGARTMEVGIGLSTVLFTALGCDHMCITLVGDEASRVREYCGAQGIDDTTLEIAVGPSDEVLPSLRPGPLELFFIDGGHGFPSPMIDFHYGARWLAKGGLLVVDDLQLAAPAVLADFLDLSTTWSNLVRGAKWGAWQRLDEGPMRSHHFEQPFLDRHWLPPYLSAPDEASHLLRRGVDSAKRRVSALRSSRRS
jgi:hypothetical protein